MKIAFIFPGQGSQKIGMGKDFYDNFTYCKDILNLCSNVTDIDFKTIMFEDNELINISEYTQPAIMISSILALTAFNNMVDIKPSFVLGHSLGEFSALVSSNGLEIDRAVKLVNLRGKLMKKACENKDAGMMVVLGLTDDIVENICKSATNKGAMIYPANYNCDGQIVIAGIRSDLINLQTDLKNVGAKRAMLLNMSVASHCPILLSVADEFQHELENNITDLTIPVVSNVTAQTYEKKSQAVKLLRDQLISPVLYKQSITNFENEIDVFIEFGSSVLTNLNKKITSKPTFSITDVESLENTVKGLKNI